MILPVEDVEEQKKDDIDGDDAGVDDGGFDDGDAGDDGDQKEQDGEQAPRRSFVKIKGQTRSMVGAPGQFDDAEEEVESYRWS